MALVDDSGGDEGLAKSYLWQKLAAPADMLQVLIPQASWGEGGESCGQQASDPFGVRMPVGGATTIAERYIAPIRNWICAGAPAP